MSHILFIVWQDDDAVGVPIIDEQHRGIIATINSLHYFIQEGHGLEGLKPTMDILKQYMKFHVVTEDGILKKHNYQDLDQHYLKNDRLFVQFSAISQEAISYRDPMLLLKFLRHWWLDHIKEEHAKYASVLTKQSYS
ncbi:MAG: hemerythrin domain-containing protein [Methylococcales bacterium]